MFNKPPLEFLFFDSSDTKIKQLSVEPSIVFQHLSNRDSFFHYDFIKADMRKRDYSDSIYTNLANVTNLNTNDTSIALVYILPLEIHFFVGLKDFIEMGEDYKTVYYRADYNYCSYELSYSRIKSFSIERNRKQDKLTLYIAKSIKDPIVEENKIVFLFPTNTETDYFDLIVQRLNRIRHRPHKNKGE